MCFIFRLKLDLLLQLPYKIYLYLVYLNNPINYQLTFKRMPIIFTFKAVQSLLKTAYFIRMFLINSVCIKWWGWRLNLMFTAHIDSYLQRFFNFTIWVSLSFAFMNLLFLMIKCIDPHRWNSQIRLCYGCNGYGCDYNNTSA